MGSSGTPPARRQDAPPATGGDSVKAQMQAMVERLREEVRLAEMVASQRAASLAWGEPDTTNTTPEAAAAAADFGSGGVVNAAPDITTSYLDDDTLELDLVTGAGSQQHGGRLPGASVLFEPPRQQAGVRLRYPEDGSTYDGDCVRGVRHGRGVMRYANGDVYNGQWVMGARHGRGTLHMLAAVSAASAATADSAGSGNHRSDTGGDGVGAIGGNVYVGDWSEDMPHGSGTYTFSNGDM